MKKAYIDQKLCVACGCCLSACGAGAVSISRGIHAVIDRAKCRGCGMCAKNCPAGIITVKKEEEYEQQ